MAQLGKLTVPMRAAVGDGLEADLLFNFFFPI
jgi:hypothetical protein